jgi:hypothetical protein
MVLRTRFFDEFLLRATAAEGTSQVVLLAAGLDSRALDDPVGYLTTLGWRATLSQCGAADADYGGWPYPVIPITGPDLPHHWLATATKAQV